MNTNSISSNTIFLPAAFWQRIAALIYDSFVMFSVILLATAIATFCYQGKSFYDIRVFYWAYLFIVWGIFLCWFWQQSGQTLGMLAWKIKVVDQANRKITWKKAVKRYVYSVLSVGGFDIG